MLDKGNKEECKALLNKIKQIQVQEYYKALKSKDYERAESLKRDSVITPKKNHGVWLSLLSNNPNNEEEKENEDNFKSIYKKYI